MIDYDSLLSRAGRKMQQSEIRKMGTVLAQAGNVVSFAPGYPDPAAFPWVDLRQITADLLSGGHGSALQYGPTRGARALREVVTGILATRGVAAAPDDVLITTGSQQGLDLMARVLLDPGDVVLVELPSYTGAITAFRNAQAELVGVRQEADGVDLDDLDAVTARLRADGRRLRALYVVPNFQNPTGLLIGREKRVRLLEWAARQNVLILEDDPYCDLSFEDGATRDDIRPIKADDHQGRVVYLSSFSKTLAPGLRVAWLTAAGPLVARMEVAKQAVDLCTGALDQHIVLEACRRGVIDRLVPRLRRHYQHKRDVMESALKKELSGAISWHTPRGGFFLWARLPDQVDADAMLKRALAHGVIYVAGSAFFVGGRGKNFLRLSFSTPSPERVVEGVSRLATAVREEIAAMQTV